MDGSATLILPLRRGREVALLSSGMRHPRSSWLPGEVFTRYEDVTHLYGGSRWVRIGSRSGVWLLSRASFLQAGDAERLVRELLARIAAGPGAGPQLAHMAQVEERQRHPARLRATLLLLALCALCFGVQVLGDGSVEEVAAFGSTLGRIEPWRYLTANLLHATFLPPHLLLNAMAILVFGSLIERPLGSFATTFVMAVSGVAAMVGASAAGLESVIGASGIASGLVGALLWLEFRHGDDLPASWRIPRRLFVTLVVVEHLMLLPIPFVAVSGHLGGMTGGVLAAALVSRPALAGEVPPWLRLANAAVGLALATSLSVVTLELADDESVVLARRGERLLRLDTVPAGLLNDTAWMIAISRGSSEPELGVALRLAERAVDLSERSDANILDTLAEVLFQVGRESDALSTIDEAIRLEPEERYFREQRRRFQGERLPGDRPEPPGLVPLFEEPLEEPGIRV
jgi:membrane associated rhomboid family serine protease